MAEFPLFARLILAGALTMGLTISEYLLSHFTHSITLLAVANHSFYNLLTLGFGATSIALTKSNAKFLTSKSTFGFHRMEVLGSLISLVFLASLSFGTSIEALQTILHSGHLDLMHQPANIFILACTHMLVWVIVLTLIGGYSHYQKRCIRYECKVPEKHYVTPYLKDIHKYDVLRDLTSCGLLMLTSGLVYFINEERHPRAIKFVDPCIALVSIGIIIVTSGALIKRLAMILLQCAPINVAKLKQEIKEDFPQINVHDFHLWSLMHGEIVGNLHATYTDTQTYGQLQLPLIDFLRSKGVTQVTIQPEFCDVKQRPSVVCTLMCKETGCQSQRCCNC